MRSLTIAFGVVLALSAMAGCKKKGGSGAPLDGMTFLAKSPGQPDDVISFAGGKIDSKGCRKYGFKPAAYKATKSGPGWKFTATAKSAKEGTNQWSGTVAGGNITATLKWVKPGQKPITYAFMGSLKK